MVKIKKKQSQPHAHKEIVLDKINDDKHKVIEEINIQKDATLEEENTVSNSVINETDNVKDATLDETKEKKSKDLYKSNNRNRQNNEIQTHNRALIEIKDFDVFYGDFQAIKGVTLDIEENKVTAFIGPSGCGKSTLLRSINRMNDLVESFHKGGQILLDGKDIYDGYDEYKLRRQIGMVFQQPNPFPKTIYDNVAFGPRTHGVTKKSELDEIVETSLRQAAIWEEVKDKLHQSATAVSGGQQQRICIARAVAVKPQVILLDEPTSALDPIATNKIEDLIFDLKENYTIAIVTHNMQQATRVSDYTAFFYLGELIEFNDTEELFANPREERTENYISGRFG